MKAPRAVDIRLCPTDMGEGADECGVRPDPQLESQGWVRRHLADPDRAKESIALYESLGYEVKARTLTPDDLHAQCRQCASVICGSYVLIYTRKRKPDSDERRAQKG